MNQKNLIKTALITGGATRIGRALALTLARDGYAIAIHYHRSEKAAEQLKNDIEAMGGKAAIVRADFYDSDAVASLIEKAQAALGPIGCLINNAALFEKDSLATLTNERAMEHYQVNCLAPLSLMRAFRAQLDSQAHGHIIQLLDGLVGWSMSAGYFSYALSKESLWSATRMLAREFAPNIQVNAIAPGASLEGAQDHLDTFATLNAVTPLAHASSEKEIAEAVKFLLSAPSITGQKILLSGGIDLPMQFACIDG